MNFHTIENDVLINLKKKEKKRKKEKRKEKRKKKKKHKREKKNIYCMRG